MNDSKDAALAVSAGLIQTSQLSCCRRHTGGKSKSTHRRGNAVIVKDGTAKHTQLEKQTNAVHVMHNLAS